MYRKAYVFAKSPALAFWKFWDSREDKSIYEVRDIINIKSKAREDKYRLKRYKDFPVVAILK